jgi:rRNA maturation protein Nop10
MASARFTLPLILILSLVCITDFRCEILTLAINEWRVIVSTCTIKGTGKVLPRTGHEGPKGEQMYSYTLPSTSALDGDGWSTPRPGRFTPGKTRYRLYRRLGGTQGRSGWVRKISPAPGFDPRTAQPVASRYTYCAIPAPQAHVQYYKKTSRHENCAPLQRTKENL